MVKITVRDTNDNVVKVKGEDYICLTENLIPKEQSGNIEALLV